MSTHGDGGKGSSRRKEDVRAINNNWDTIFGTKHKELAVPIQDAEEDAAMSCDVCGADMLITDTGMYLFCDNCGHREELEWDDSNV